MIFLRVSVENSFKLCFPLSVYPRGRVATNCLSSTPRTILTVKFDAPGAPTIRQLSSKRMELMLVSSDSLIPPMNRQRSGKSPFLPRLNDVSTCWESRETLKAARAGQPIKSRQLMGLPRQQPINSKQAVRTGANCSFNWSDRTDAGWPRGTPSIIMGQCHQLMEATKPSAAGNLVAPRQGASFFQCGNRSNMPLSQIIDLRVSRVGSRWWAGDGLTLRGERKWGSQKNSWYMYIAFRSSLWLNTSPSSSTKRGPLYAKTTPLSLSARCVCVGGGGGGCIMHRFTSRRYKRDSSQKIWCLFPYHNPQSRPFNVSSCQVTPRSQNTSRKRGEKNGEQNELTSRYHWNV